ncbi:PLDc_N domain-containing protein [Prescottella agglutinans]|uniref:PLDc_N domain-containing protein n=1 Tax=Prescottella agglutinans TaxID=1644129 RepID=A0A3S3ZXH1_9NOCA|nr:PLD nuclease N-terminal domain-containing protein [Prescottella agglutinans]RVW10477.1 PLDc_N domain-containing protein [Prescottella agglutinans]
MEKSKWADMSPAKRASIIALASVQLSLAVSAWADLATRRRDQVNGSKGKWAAIIAVNFIGPLSYFRWGRKKSA